MNIDELKIALYNLILSFSYGLIGSKDFWDRYRELKRRIEELEKMK